MNIDSEQDLRDIRALCRVASKLVFDEMDKVRASGARVVEAATVELLEDLLLHTAVVCDRAVAKYEAGDAHASQIAEINEWTATEFRRGQRSADEIVAEAAQRLKALS